MIRIKKIINRQLQEAKHCKFWRANVGGSVNLKGFTAAAVLDLTDDHEAGYAVEVDEQLWVTPDGEVVIIDFLELATLLAEELIHYVPPLQVSSLPVARLINGACRPDSVWRDLIVDRWKVLLSSDCLCYRSPNLDLSARQREICDPPIRWLSEKVGAKLDVSDGFNALTHSPQAVDKISAWLKDTNRFRRIAVASLSEILSSPILAVALANDAIDPEQAWCAARTEETWQRERWGSVSEQVDADAAHREAYDVALSVLRATSSARVLI